MPPFRLEQPRNMPLLTASEGRFHPAPTQMVVSFEQRANMFEASVRLLVSKPLRPRCSRLLQSENICDMLVTLLVLKLFRFSSVSDLHI